MRVAFVVPHLRLASGWRSAAIGTVRAVARLLAPEERGLNFEGFGLVFLEAGAYGLPVVATRSGGVEDAVEDGVSGYLTAPGSPTAIADALLTLLEDHDLARAMGMAGRRRAERLSWRTFAGHQLNAYRQLRAEPARCSPSPEAGTSDHV